MVNDRSAYRLSAVLMTAGVVVSFAAGILHPDHEMANDHHAVFKEYAASVNWTAIHLGQFTGMAILIAGVLMLLVALDARSGARSVTARLGTWAAVTALAMYAVLQAVDGVALKQAVDAWMAAAPEVQAIHFAAAEGVRWLEWGARSYQSFVLGAAFVLTGATMAMTRSVRLLGYVVGAAGVSYIVQGWVVGTTGFSNANSIPTLAGIVLVVLSSIWLVISSVTMRSDPALSLQPAE